MGPPRGLNRPYLGPLFEPSWAGGPKKGSDLKPVKQAGPQGGPGTAQKGLQKAPQIGPKIGPFGAPFGALLGRRPQKGVRFHPAQAGPAPGAAQTPQKGVSECTPKIGLFGPSQGPKWAQYGLVTLGSQTAVNVISAHIPLQKGLQKGVQKGLFGTPFWSPPGREPSKRGSI